jgi:hypothetical protein
MLAPILSPDTVASLGSVSASPTSHTSRPLTFSITQDPFR